MAALALNNCKLSATNVSPFFLDHSFNMELWDLLQDLSPNYVGCSPIKWAKAVIAKLRDAKEHAKVAMAASQ